MLSEQITYEHFTSPLSRLARLKVHRTFTFALEGAKDRSSSLFFYPDRFGETGYPNRALRRGAWLMDYAL